MKAQRTLGMQYWMVGLLSHHSNSLPAFILKPACSLENDAPSERNLGVIVFLWESLHRFWCLPSSDIETTRCCCPQLSLNSTGLVSYSFCLNLNFLWDGTWKHVADKESRTNSLFPTDEILRTDQTLDCVHRVVTSYGSVAARNCFKIHWK